MSFDGGKKHTDGAEDTGYQHRDLRPAEIDSIQSISDQINEMSLKLDPENKTSEEQPLSDAVRNMSNNLAQQKGIPAEQRNYQPSNGHSEHPKISSTLLRSSSVYDVQRYSSSSYHPLAVQPQRASAYSNGLILSNSITQHRPKEMQEYFRTQYAAALKRVMNQLKALRDYSNSLENTVSIANAENSVLAQGSKSDNPVSQFSNTVFAEEILRASQMFEEIVASHSPASGNNNLEYSEIRNYLSGIWQENKKKPGKWKWVANSFPSYLASYFSNTDLPNNSITLYANSAALYNNGAALSNDDAALPSTASGVLEDFNVEPSCNESDDDAHFWAEVKYEACLNGLTVLACNDSFSNQIAAQYESFLNIYNEWTNFDSDLLFDMRSEFEDTDFFNEGPELKDFACLNGDTEFECNAYFDNYVDFQYESSLNRYNEFTNLGANILYGMRPEFEDLASFSGGAECEDVASFSGGAECEDVASFSGGAECEDVASFSGGAECEDVASFSGGAEFEDIASFSEDAEFEDLASFSEDVEFEDVASFNEEAEFEDVASFSEDAEFDDVASLNRGADFEDNEGSLNRGAGFEDNEGSLKRDADFEDFASVNREVNFEVESYINTNVKLDNLAADIPYDEQCEFEGVASFNGGIEFEDVSSINGSADFVDYASVNREADLEDKSYIMDTELNNLVAGILYDEQSEFEEVASRNGDAAFEDVTSPNGVAELEDVASPNGNAEFKDKASLNGEADFESDLYFNMDCELTNLVASILYDERSEFED